MMQKFVGYTVQFLSCLRHFISEISQLSLKIANLKMPTVTKAK